MYLFEIQICIVKYNGYNDFIESGVLAKRNFFGSVNDIGICFGMLIKKVGIFLVRQILNCA